MKRRHLLTAAAVACTTFTSAAWAQASNYPSQPVTLVVPYSAGGTTDVLARALALGMGKHLGQTVIIENKPGAAGAMGAVEMLKTRPDGYKIALTPVGIFRQPYLQKTPYHPINDLTYIASFTAYDFLLAVAQDSPLKSLQDLVAFAKQNPDVITYGSPGNFTGNQVAMVMMAKAADVKVVHVPYKSDNESLSSVMAGHTKAVVSTNGIKPYMDSKKVRALAIASEQRSAAFPDVPTFKELGYDAVVPSPLGISGPKGLPAPIVAKLDAAIKAALDEPEVKRAIDNFGMRVDYRNPADYAAFAKQTFASEEKLIKSMSTGLSN